MPVSTNIQQQAKEAITILKRGGIVAFPTDTVYGLGASVNILHSVERIYQVKERPRKMALPILIAHISHINDVASSVSAVAWLLARSFLPGALTIVLYKSNLIPDIVTAGDKTVAVRVPAHPVPIAIIEGLGTPIVGTSANVSGKPSALTADEVQTQFGDKVDLIIDGGRCPSGKESTVVDVTVEPPVILREGAISIKELKRVYNKIIIKEMIG